MKAGRGERRAFGLKDVPPTPMFFVSVASKQLSQAVSLLFATLAGRSISVAAKGLRGIAGQGVGIRRREKSRGRGE